MENLIRLKNKLMINKAGCPIIIWIISSILICFSLYLIVLLYLTNRSLWIDEAMLAFSFTKRGFIDLTKNIFEWDQTAPILYLYVVKIITSLFGNSEFTLRIYSLFAYIMTLLLSYLVMDRVFKIKYPILGVAFISNIKILIYYANEFKPYMNDAFMVLTVIYLFYMFNEEKLKFGLLIAVFALMIWFSYPALFFIAGILLFELVDSIRLKEPGRFYKIAIGGILVLVSFLIYYFIWIKPIATDDYMVSFWMDYKFPLIPTSLNDLYRIFFLSGLLIADMKLNIIMVGIFITIGVVLSFLKISKYHIVIYISIFLMLFASYIGKYPFYSRLMLFIYPILGIYIFIALSRFMDIGDNKARSILNIGVVLALMLSNYGSVSYLRESNRHVSRNELNPLIEYVEKNIKKNEMLYVYYRAIPGYVFKTGHENLSIGDRIEPGTINVVLGKGTIPLETKGIDTVDIEKIIDYKKAYILVSHQNDEKIQYYLSKLNQHGNVELIMESYETPLYYYSADTRDMKSRIVMELVYYKEDGNKGLLNLRIENIGGSYFNSSLDDIILIDRLNNLVEFKILEKDLLPRDSIIISIEFEWEDNINEMELQLFNNGKYWFDDLGVAPILINRIK